MIRFNFSVRNGKRWNPYAILTLVSLFRSPFRFFSFGRPVSAVRLRGAALWGKKSDRPEARKNKLRLSHTSNIFVNRASFSASFPEGKGHYTELRAISTARLNASPRLHLRPINVVVFNGPLTRSYLGVGFVLRCFQHLSNPDAATRLCPWRDNRHTGGLSSTVLSY